MEQTSIERYGVSHKAKLEETQEKKRKTNRERYGADTPAQSPEVAEKMRSYFSEHPEVIERAAAKRRETLSKRGVDNPAQLPEARKKLRDVRKRDTEETKRKRSSSLSRSCSLPETKEKRAKTNYERYGYEFPAFQDPERFGPIHEKAMHSSGSRLEDSMSDFLSSIGVEHGRNVYGVIDGGELDIYVEEKNFAIELNGTAWHNSTSSPKGRPKHRNYHRDKTLAAQQAGIQLLHVWEWQVTNPIKFEIVKSMVAAKLGIVDRVLRASKCDVVDISTKEAKAFVERCHIQGYEASREAKALVHDGSVVAVMCFRGDELTRFCSELGTRIHGGFSKLMKAFGKSCITTFSFNDYSDGGVYERMGFKRTSDVDPRYWWVRGDDVLTRRSCQKKLISARWPEYYNYQDKADNRTEKELMEGLGYVQMYDSGKVKWELSII